jgi:plasmid maintenance system antidote protein VapI
MEGDNGHTQQEKTWAAGPSPAMTQRVAAPLVDALIFHRALTAETAILLAERFGTSAEVWLNLQMMHDLDEARRRMGRVAA